MAKTPMTDDARELSAEAEGRLARDPPAAKPRETTAAVLHELQVHQIELEMQNEELRRAHLELGMSRDRYVDLYDFAPVGYLTVDEAGQVTHANLTSAALLGMERKGLLGRPFAGFVDPPDADRWHLFLTSLFHREEGSCCDLGLRRGDGSVFRGHLACQPRAAGDSDPAVRIALSDVTERSRTEEVFAFLAQSIHAGQGVRFFDDLATFLARILHMDFVCIDRLSGDGLTAETLAVWCDGSFQDNVSYALKDTPCGDVVGKDVCCFPASVCQFFPEDTVLQDLRAESYVGVTLWSHTGEPIGLIAVIGRSPLANPEVAAAVLRQVTVRASNELERMGAERALRESEARLRAFVDAIPGPVFLKDVESRWLVGNRALFEVVGKSATSSIGKTDREIYDDPAVGDAVMENDRRIMNSGVSEVVQETIPTPLGTRIFHSTKVPYRDASGRVVGIIGSAVDITETRALQRQMAMTSRLAALGTLVTGVAHEINNPLAAALSDIEFAMNEVDEVRGRLHGSGPLDREAERRHLVEVVAELGYAQDAGRRIERIVKDLKAFGRPDQGNAREQIRLIDVVDLAMRWLPATVDQTATVTVENGGAPDVVATIGQISQVLVNLVTNAAKATSEAARGAIVVRVGPGLPGMARMEVSDDGTGMTPEIMEHVFEPFFTTSDVGKGTGLGLSICHAIVTGHGGTLTVESQVGKGSTFRVELPAAPA